jgi:TctA family transporter
MEGVICGEVANNANVGGSLVPAMTLGIPGNNAAVLFMAALNLHGIVLGPTVQDDHPGLIGYVLAALVVANLALLVSPKFLARLRRTAFPGQSLSAISGCRFLSTARGSAADRRRAVERGLGW